MLVITREVCDPVVERSTARETTDTSATARRELLWRNPDGADGGVGGGGLPWSVRLKALLDAVDPQTLSSAARSRSLDPFQLARTIERKQERIYRLANRRLSPQEKQETPFGSRRGKNCGKDARRELGNHKAISTFPQPRRRSRIYGYIANVSTPSTLRTGSPLNCRGNRLGGRFRAYGSLMGSSYGRSGCSYGTSRTARRKSFRGTARAWYPACDSLLLLLASFASELSSKASIVAEN
jgi:hypothetical protein